MTAPLASVQACEQATLTPAVQERPCLFADRVGAWYIASRSSQYRKAHGLYLTPVPVADFMATLIEARGTTVRLLDPAAGAGILCCAVVERLVSRQSVPSSIELVAYESDGELCGRLATVLEYLAEWCRHRHVLLTVRIESEDFVAAHADALQSAGDLLPSNSPIANFDAVIANPPYFKIGRNDPRALAVSSVVHGQPNIYALFMAVGAALLRRSGEFVQIVPRSFASGPYFRQFRSVFFDLIEPTVIHAFDSRRSAFSRDDVLQEKGVADIGSPTRRRAPLATVLNPSDRHQVLRVPLSDDAAAVLALVDGWPCTLADLGLAISTGPVVPFRAASAVCASGDVPDTHAPLLWMNHVRPMQVTWPLRRHKKEYVLCAGAEHLLLKNCNYVLIRRFSAKEEKRRLTAAPYVAKQFRCTALGLENHLNYVHRPKGVLSEDECWGLAALYNSRLLDSYFRCINGNTQVSATELRAMPLPTASAITALGRRVKGMADPLATLDDAVMAIAVPQTKGQTTLGKR